MSLIEQPRQVEQELRVSHLALGFASPLWGLYTGAAMTGMAFWWLNAWTRPQNLEALFEATAEALPETPVVTTPLVLVETAVILEPVLAAEAAIEAAVEVLSPEPMVEAVARAVETVEAVIEPLVEPVVEASRPDPRPKAPKTARSA